MLAKEIRVGGVYVAKVSNKLTRVRVTSIDEIRPYLKGKFVIKTVYRVINLVTGRETTFRSAAKFRSEVVAK